MYFTHLDLSSVSSSFAGRAVTIGSFDGLHIGHLRILEELNHYAKAHNLQRTLITFIPLPPEYFNKGISFRLMSLRDKLEYLKSNDLVDEVILIPFSGAMSSITAESFLHDVLIELIDMKALFVGKDFKFGHKAEGNVEFLRNTLHGQFYFQAIDDLISNNLRVSSTKIRDFLANNDLAATRAFLGRDYSLIGKVIYGNQLARSWGMPTINVHLKHNFPLRGVFNVTATSLCTDKKYYGTANMGVRPTINGTKLSLEVHLHDTDENLYDQYFKITFLDKIRDEVKFNSLDDLRLQIERDITNSYSFFKNFRNR